MKRFSRRLPLSPVFHRQLCTGPGENFSKFTVNQRRNKYLQLLSEAATVIERSPDHGSRVGALLHEGLNMLAVVESRLEADSALCDDKAIATVIADLKETASDIKYKFEL